MSTDVYGISGNFLADGIRGIIDGYTTTTDSDVLCTIGVPWQYPRSTINVDKDVILFYLPCPSLRSLPLYTKPIFRASTNKSGISLNQKENYSSSFLVPNGFHRVFS